MLRLPWNFYSLLLFLCFLNTKRLHAETNTVIGEYVDAEIEEVHFFTGTWNQTLEWADFMKRPIMVYLKKSSHIEASKHLEEVVFQYPSLAKYLNKNYINLRMNLNELNGEGFSLATQYEVKDFPCLLFFSQKGLLLLKYEMQVERDLDLKVRFQQLIREAERRRQDSSPSEFNIMLVNSSDDTAIPAAFQYFLNAKAQYELGKREQDFLHNFAYTLKNFNESYHYVVEEYMQLHADLENDNYCRFVLDFADNIENQAFKTLVNQRSLFEQKLGKSRVEMCIKQTFRKEVLEAKYNKDSAAFKRCFELVKVLELENQKDFLQYLKKVYN
ncbi:MAG: hypothetical protein ACPGXL_08275 [Chitinophagales bacterium]